ncbi:MAG: ATP-binding protein [Ilumatobacteraceae bacterium]
MYDNRAVNASEARTWVDEFLAEHAIDDQLRDDAQLVVSELITNALMHGGGGTVLRASVTGDTVRLAVTDSGDELPEVLPIDPMRIGGLGLIVVDRVARKWGVSTFPGGKTVWATLSITG